MVLPKRKWKSSWWQYHDAISSRANNTPPTGARKAAAIPAADPHVTRSRRSRSFLKYRNHLHVNPYFFDPPWPINAATHAPVCTMGPALPIWRDDDTAQMLPTICKSTRDIKLSNRNRLVLPLGKDVCLCGHETKMRKQPNCLLLHWWTNHFTHGEWITGWTERQLQGGWNQ